MNPQFYMTRVTARLGNQVLYRKPWCLRGSERIRLPVAENSAFTIAGITPPIGGSPTPPQKSKVGTSTGMISGLTLIRASG